MIGEVDADDLSKGFAGATFADHSTALPKWSQRVLQLDSPGAGLVQVMHEHECSKIQSKSTIINNTYIYIIYI